MAAEKQLAKDLAAVNKPAKKALAKKLTSITKKTKNAAPIVLIRQKLSAQPRLATRKPRKEYLIATIPKIEEEEN
jgi:hypothetical protein